MLRLSSLTILFFGSLSLLAQDKPVYPHTMAPWEVPLIRDYRESRAGQSRGIETPPPLSLIHI